MTEPTTPAPEPRIGDADRDQAVGFLQEHMAQGRLDAAEFDERMGRALSAKTASELEVLFQDLPEPRPTSTPATFAAPPWAQGPASPPSTSLAARAAAPLPEPVRQSNKGLTVAAAVAWPVVLMFLFATGSWGSLWWLIFIPVAISSIAGGRHQRGHHG